MTSLLPSFAGLIKEGLLRTSIIDTGVKSAFEYYVRLSGNLGNLHAVGSGGTSKVVSPEPDVPSDPRAIAQTIAAFENGDFSFFSEGSPLIYHHLLCILCRMRACRFFLFLYFVIMNTYKCNLSLFFLLGFLFLIVTTFCVSLLFMS